MGQENSREQVGINVPPRTISSRSIDGIAKYILDGRAKHIVVVAGAGMSTSAGIPDFRSPETGLYANLGSLELPYPEAVFDMAYFRNHPEPFYMLARELYPGRFYPTIAHSFVALLNEKLMLRMLFTQNIDCLDRMAGIPADKIVEAHGSFASQGCIECKTAFPGDLMKDAVENSIVPHCIVPQCNGLVKPDIVFYGEWLPSAFEEKRFILEQADLVIVIGTSLTVLPFAGLPQNVPEGIPRVLINNQLSGELGCRPDDVIILGDCDSGVTKIADALGWRHDLERLWYNVSGKHKEQKAETLRQLRTEITSNDALEADVQKLTAEVDESLKLTEAHTLSLHKLLGIGINNSEIDSDKLGVTVGRQSEASSDSSSVKSTEADVKEFGTSPGITTLIERESARASSSEKDLTLPHHRLDQSGSENGHKVSKSII